jgi:hypothetical protein
LAEEIGTILKSAFADHSLKVALVLARHHGWPVDYFFQDKSSKYVIVIPVTTILGVLDTQSLRIKEEAKLV